MFLLWFCFWNFHNFFKRIQCPKVSNPQGCGTTPDLYFCRTVIQNVGPVASSWSVLDTVVCQHAVTRTAELLGRDSLQSIKLQQLQNPSRAVILIMSFRASTHAAPPFQIAFYWFRLTARFITQARIVPTLMLSDRYWSWRLKEKHQATRALTSTRYIVANEWYHLQ
jgi:hypothetical protein